MMPNNPYNEPHHDTSREPLVAPYTCYNGAVISKQWVLDEYNVLSAEIHRWEDSGRGVPSHLLNARHRHFATMAKVFKGGYKHEHLRRKRTKVLFREGIRYEINLPPNGKGNERGV